MKHWWFKKRTAARKSDAVAAFRAAVQPSVDEVILSTDDMRNITCAWLYKEVESQRKQRLMILMLLYSNPDVKDLAHKLGITKEKLLEALKELQTPAAVEAFKEMSKNK